jgi:glycosyltransferase involved in cell wall biosynthesis
MKIAIVAPSPVPFTVGGAEKLWWGLSDHINQCTPHQADLIKLPSPESDFWSIVASYRAFSRLDLTHFDLVISTKYPAWMIEHPNHLCYMQHRLRGLYDTYHFTRLPTRYDGNVPAIRELLDWMDAYAGDRACLGEWFGRVEVLRDAVPREVFAFPGPFAREAVYFLDGIGLSRAAVRRFAAISQNVASRTGYFPPGARVDVIHHPSDLRSFKTGSFDYLFTVSRLDNAKRIGLLIDAMRQTRADVELRIAGTGPEADNLRRRAAGDRRIKFLGLVNDADVVNLYADALAVPYVPYDEDYGLVTIEAMASGKPVLTTSDAGGPNEFVRDGRTGYSVAPDAHALAKRIEYLCAHRAEARSMGCNAQRSVRHITWEDTVGRLLNTRCGANGARVRLVPVAGETRVRRRKLTVAVHFPVHPPRGGGQSRVFHLYRHLAQWMDVEILSFAADDNQAFDGEIAPGVREIRVPRSPEHRHAEAELGRGVNWVPVTDVAMPQLAGLSPDYFQALRRSAADADAVVASHPYLLPAIEAVCDRPVWYEGHNVEAELKRAVLPSTPTGLKLLQSVRDVERDCCARSSLIMACSEEDRRRLSELYHADESKIVVVPNGVDLETVNYVAPDQRRMDKRRLGLERNFIVLFIGAWHGPNLDAVRSIFDWARRLPDVSFIVLGSAGLAFQAGQAPPNVGLTGVVDDVTKDAVLAVADLAINPVTIGSGTNLKMLDYVAAGIPVLSTSHGARGLGLRDGGLVDIAEPDDFVAGIRRMRNDWASLEDRISAGRTYVAERFAWPAIAATFVDALAAAGDRPWRGGMGATPRTNLMMSGNLMGVNDD